MAKFKLPNRKWYTLQQAADKLSREAGEPVTVDDLIHYWITEKLHLVLNINFEKSHLKIGNTEINSYEISTFYNESPDKKTNVKLRDLEVEDYFYSMELLESLDFKEDANSFHRKAHEIFEGYLIYGFVYTNPPKHWEITKENEKYYSNIQEINFMSPANENLEFIFFEITLKNKISILINDYYVLHQDLEYFMQGKSRTKEIQSYPKTRNAQAEFIYHLLCLQYGKERADKIRAEIENRNSEIRKEFEIKGWNLPSGKAVQKWINDFID